jgi:hypothetical protein
LGAQSGPEERSQRLGLAFHVGVVVAAPDSFDGSQAFQLRELDVQLFPLKTVCLVEMPIQKVADFMQLNVLLVVNRGVLVVHDEVGVLGSYQHSVDIAAAKPERQQLKSARTPVGDPFA